MGLDEVGTFTLKEEAPDYAWLAILYLLTATRVDKVLSVGSESSLVINPSDETGFGSGGVLVLVLIPLFGGLCYFFNLGAMVGN